MFDNRRVRRPGDAPGDQPGEGGSNPTYPLLVQKMHRGDIGAYLSVVGGASVATGNVMED